MVENETEGSDIVEFPQDDTAEFGDSLKPNWEKLARNQTERTPIKQSLAASGDIGSTGEKP